ncbi:hypothetical protein OPV22_021000 [Ensete ventricosum]|uniref:CASP-like protein n=1 Tax=Ensete ventricosum TaxID=4639 RepID=A0AAV8QK76_ENSVE|nr:hypothetical protein OPV22_021000 [Ensete ventricosum]
MERTPTTAFRKDWNVGKNLTSLSLSLSIRLSSGSSSSSSSNSQVHTTEAAIIKSFTHTSAPPPKAKEQRKLQMLSFLSTALPFISTAAVYICKQRGEFKIEFWLMEESTWGSCSFFFCCRGLYEQG